MGPSGVPRIHTGIHVECGGSWTLEQSFCGVWWCRIFRIQSFKGPSLTLRNTHWISFWSVRWGVGNELCGWKSPSKSEVERWAGVRWVTNILALTGDMSSAGHSKIKGYIYHFTGEQCRQTPAMLPHKGPPPPASNWHVCSQPLLFVQHKINGSCDTALLCTSSAQSISHH